MHGKRVHFASKTFPDTPSPTFSLMSFTSSGGPRTPVPAAGSPLTGYTFAIVNPVLGIQKYPMLEYDVSYHPSHIKFNMPTVHSYVLNELATNPPIPSMVIRCSLLPWMITIVPTTTKYVTVGDVFHGIYSNLRLAASKADFKRLLSSTEARRMVSNAYTRRYKRIDNSEAREVEQKKGLKRVDFLGEHTVFMGLSSTMEGPHVWSLSMSSSSTRTL